MQKKIASVLFSTRLTAVLFIVFAVAMAAGTFMDADSQSPPTPYTRELIYNAWWFEAIMLLFVINFVGNIFRYNLHKREMWASLMLHLAFILVIVGAFVTRYIGFEGIMHIREGQTENTILSDQTYLDVFIDGDYMVDGVAQRRKLKPKKLRLSEKLNNDFTINTDYNGQPVTIKFKNFIKGAIEGLTKSENGEEYLKIVESGDGERHDHWVKVGEVSNIHNILFAINKPTDGAINITYSEDGKYSISSPFDGNFMIMADQSQGEVVADSVQPFNLRSLYRMGGISFVVPEPITKGNYGIVKAGTGEPANQDALILEISSKDETKTVELLGGRGTAINPTETEIAGLKVYSGYGSESIDLPFSIT
ncbi:MAG TPA: cytochrome C biogenesis protein, partial [Aequorivita sp.]|nr:cytochrome C biogenesis protein [Aequorivita sp.]